MNTWEGFVYGLGIALQPATMLYCLAGVSLGTLIGVLPGMGALAAISLLLPMSYYMPSEAALIMLAGVYYGSQYGGSVAAILLRLPGTPQSALTCLDGYPLAQQGRAATALFTAMTASFSGSMLGVLILLLAAPWLVRLSAHFGSVEYAAIMALGLVAAATIGSRAPARGLAMILCGLMLGTVGTDLDSGQMRFTFGQPQLMDGINLVALAMALFGIAEVITNLGKRPSASAQTTFKFEKSCPRRAEWRRIVPAILRGTSTGAFFGTLPGTGSTLSAFLAYASEQKLSAHPERFGHGQLEGIAAPEAANNSAAITAFIPTLTLGIPGDAIMALLLGAMMIHGIQPGPMMLAERPEMFWGLIASFAIGNLFLLLLNWPLIRIWIAILRIPLHWLYPAIVLFVCMGAYAVRGSTFDILSVAVLGAIGHLLTLLRFSPSLLLLGFVLGPLFETNLRRALLLSRGEFSIFLQKPLSATLTLAALLLIARAIWQTARKKPQQHS